MSKYTVNITVEKQEITVGDFLWVSGSKEIYGANITFSEEWEGFAKKAVFQINKDDPVEVDIVDNHCDIPVLLRPGMLRIGIYGIKDDDPIQVMPTVWATRKIVEEGAYL